MEFEGVVHKILPMQQGTSARGEWQKQDVVFELPTERGRKICVTFFNRPSDVEMLHEGSTYIVSTNVESREFNGRWFTDVRGWRVQPATNSAQSAGAGADPTSVGSAEAAARVDAPWGDEPVGSGERSEKSTPVPEVDDLPF